MVNKILNWVVFSTWVLIILWIFIIWIYLVKWSDLITATDWENLSAEKWNQLVNKVDSIKWLEDAKVISCRYYNTNAWSIWWITKTWTTADCNWFIPSSYTNCVISNRQTDWNWVHRWLQNCDKNEWWTYLDVNNSEVLFRCEYLCRN